MKTIFKLFAISLCLVGILLLSIGPSIHTVMNNIDVTNHQMMFHCSKAIIGILLFGFGTVTGAIVHVKQG